ncbi:hypothetical protein DFH08DRAFT_804645 [Mycena albidolilacea]|uniref:Uncharacterized protein n=1 Tax=Mycena albidolilacea TaxID=1033008 RepID=A0AAD7A9R4_9AGAR|nr:hypothetical protein DFH08DRAFT_804645 [Mycena albidolilacea]
MATRSQIFRTTPRRPFHRPHAQTHSRIPLNWQILEYAGPRKIGRTGRQSEVAQLISLSANPDSVTTQNPFQHPAPTGVWNREGYQVHANEQVEQERPNDSMPVNASIFALKILPLTMPSQASWSYVNEQLASLSINRFKIQILSGWVYVEHCNVNRAAEYYPSSLVSVMV